MVFEWFPILKGKYFTYQEYFSFSIAGFTAMVAIGLYLIAKLLPFASKPLITFLKLSRYKKPRIITELIKIDDMELPTTAFQSSQPLSPSKLFDVVSDEDDSEAEITTETKVLLCFSTLVNIFSWLSAIMWAFIPIVFMGFDLLNPIWSIVLSSLILLNEYLNYLYRQYPSASKRANSKISRISRVLRIAAQHSTAAMQGTLILIAIYSFGLTFLFQGTCLALYNNENAGFVYKDAFALSTSLTRFFTLGTQCPPGPPCHFFATLPEDGSTGVIINVHTDIKTVDITIFYEEANNTMLLKGKPGKYSVKPRSFVVDKIETKGQRVAHSAVLQDLAPNTTYYIQVYYNDQIQTAASYRTLPGRNHTGNMTVVQGGDAGTNKISQKMITLVSQIDPDVVLLGGDLAYDNNIKHCYYCWDSFFRMFEELNKRVGRLVPLVMSIGNHDAGLDVDSQRKLSIDEEGPLMFVWFAQSTIPDPEKPSQRVAPDIQKRNSYDYHLLGKILLMNLDSNYLSRYDGEQLEFINSTSLLYPDYLKMAMYHEPVYSSCVGISMEGEKHWVPQFDQHRYLAVFENHAHSLKRTFPVTNRTYNPQGTIYLGDGSWGVIPTKCPENNSSGILATWQNRVNFFWLMNINEQEVKYSAINPDGEVLDQYTQNIESQRPEAEL